MQIRKRIRTLIQTIMHVTLLASPLMGNAAVESSQPLYDWKIEQDRDHWVIRINNNTIYPSTFQFECSLGSKQDTIIIEAGAGKSALKPLSISLEQANPEKPVCKASGTAGYASATGTGSYKLPFAINRGICVGQAPGAPLTTHSLDPSSINAVDFLLSEGDLVVAAREGVVFEAIDQFDAGGPSPSFRDKANAVSIIHSDGTMTLYAHLLKGTIQVKKGQTVRAGDTLGAAGKSGQAAGPHLHFAVGHPLLVKSPNGHQMLHGMTSVQPNFTIGEKIVQVHLGDYIEASESRGKYTRASAQCLTRSEFH